MGDSSDELEARRFAAAHPDDWKRDVRERAATIKLLWKTTDDSSIQLKCQYALNELSSIELKEDLTEKDFKVWMDRWKKLAKQLSADVHDDSDSDSESESDDANDDFFTNSSGEEDSGDPNDDTDTDDSATAHGNMGAWLKQQREWRKARKQGRKPAAQKKPLTVIDEFNEEMWQLHIDDLTRLNEIVLPLEEKVAKIDAVIARMRFWWGGTQRKSDVYETVNNDIAQLDRASDVFHDYLIERENRKKLVGNGTKYERWVSVIIHPATTVKETQGLVAARRLLRSGLRTMLLKYCLAGRSDVYKFLTGMDCQERPIDPPTALGKRGDRGESGQGAGAPLPPLESGQGAGAPLPPLIHGGARGGKQKRNKLAAMFSNVRISGRPPLLRTPSVFSSRV